MLLSSQEVKSSASCFQTTLREKLIKNGAKVIVLGGEESHASNLVWGRRTGHNELEARNSLIEGELRSSIFATEPNGQLYRKSRILV